MGADLSWKLQNVISMIIPVFGGPNTVIVDHPAILNGFCYDTLAGPQWVSGVSYVKRFKNEPKATATD